jgi:hypothetical protein
VVSPQQAAVEHVTRTARAARAEARERIEAVLGPGADVDGLGAGLFRRGRVAVHFHPDRLVAGGLTVAAGLRRDGVYLSQFLTGVSAGGLTAYPGGTRDRWEAAMFGGAYQGPGVRPADRPVYGALDLLGHADGPTPRFGSCRLRLRAFVLSRTTLSVGDSYGEPADRGTVAEPGPVVAGLLEEVAAGRLHLGAPELGPRDVAALLLSASRGAPGTDRLGRAMDEYVEAQVHGPVRPAEDADQLVADPSFRGGLVEGELAAIAQQCGLELRWHRGFALPVDEVPAGPRGPIMPVLARRLRDLTGSGMLTAAVIGQGAQSVVREPGAWSDLGTSAECQQHLKLLWHVLVIAGRPLHEAFGD